MTADYNGWNDAPEAEREAMDVYSRQESEREVSRPAGGNSRNLPSSSGTSVPDDGLLGPQAGSLRPHTLLFLITQWRMSWRQCLS